MTIKRFHGLFTPECDSGCGTELPAEAAFQDAVSAKKRAGWKTEQIDGEYVDTCKECQGDDPLTASRSSPKGALK